MKIWSILALILIANFGGALCWAQQVDGAAEENDIKSALAQISSQDPIQRMIAAQDALQSNDQILRMAGLDADLKSGDGHVREIGLAYLMNEQKQLIVTIDVAPDQLSQINDPNLKTSIAGVSPLTIAIQSMDPHTLVIAAYNNNLGNMAGSVTQDGLTFSLQILGTNCGLYLRGYAEGLLRGALDCGSASFAASTAVP